MPTIPQENDMQKTERICSSHWTRRGAIGAVAVGLGALVLGPSRSALADDEVAGSQRVSWDDGWEYPLVGVDEAGQWVVGFDDGEYTVDPSGWVCDEGAWHAISTVDDEGIWYSGNDGYDYVIDDWSATPEFEV
jgi:hypothetical protein